MRQPADHSAIHGVLSPVELDICRAPYAATSLLEKLGAHPQAVDELTAQGLVPRQSRWCRP
jgi:hypothetical protein